MGAKAMQGKRKKLLSGMYGEDELTLPGFHSCPTPWARRRWQLPASVTHQGEKRLNTQLIDSGEPSWPFASSGCTS